MINEFAPSSTDESPLVGLVHTIESTYAYISSESDNLVEGNRIPKEAIVFNKQGEKIEHVLYDRDSSILSKHTYTYDIRGNRTEAIIYKANGSVDNKVIYSYDASGNRTQYLCCKEDGSITEKAIYIYDAQGKLSEKNVYRADNSLKWKSLLSSDTRASLREETIYFEPDGTITKRSISVRSINGDLVESYIQEADGSLRYKISCAFDPLTGREIERAWYDSDGSLKWKWLYAYDDQGHLIEGNCYSDLVWQKYMYFYEFDSEGNWISKTKMKLTSTTEISAFMPYEVVHRTISYWSPSN